MDCIANKLAVTDAEFATTKSAAAPVSDTVPVCDIVCRDTVHSKAASTVITIVIDWLGVITEESAEPFTDAVNVISVPPPLLISA